jgi:hypothetical protein
MVIIKALFAKEAELYCSKKGIIATVLLQYHYSIFLLYSVCYHHKRSKSIKQQESAVEYICQKFNQYEESEMKNVPFHHFPLSNNM